jgi:hypothetical protein
MLSPADCPTTVANVVMKFPLVKHAVGIFGTCDASPRYDDSVCPIQNLLSRNPAIYGFLAKCPHDERHFFYHVIPSQTVRRVLDFHSMNRSNKMNACSCGHTVIFINLKEIRSSALGVISLHSFRDSPIMRSRMPVSKA